MPYSNRVAWKKLQMECPDLRRTHGFLSQGTRPSTKNTKCTITKRYLQKITISRDGLLVYKDTTPFLPTRELIVIPQHLLQGLLTSFHIRFDHPSASQLTKLFNRNFFALKLSEYITRVTNNCSQCQSIKTIPRELHPQVGKPSLTSYPCVEFAMDIIRRYRQIIFSLRDTFSSFTISQLLENEKHDTIRDALILSITQLRPTNDTVVYIRVDSAPGIESLRDDPILSSLNIILDFGRVKNVNKNPVAEKNCRELGNELLRLNPDGTPITSATLALATSNLNSRIRNRGLSAWEILHQIDQFSGEQLPFLDGDLMNKQIDIRGSNRQYSAKHKSRGGPLAEKASIAVGSLVYIKQEGSKVKNRERYIVTVLNEKEGTCEIQKFTRTNISSCRYKLKLTEIYPISPDVLHDDPSLPVRGLEIYTDDESDVDDLHANDDSSVHAICDAENVSFSNDRFYDDGVLNDDSCNVNNSCLKQEIELDKPVELTVDNDKRSRKPPQWLINGDYVLDKKMGKGRK